MTAVAAPIAFPGSQTLTDWWRQIKNYQPRTLWVAHLLLYRVECLVRVKRRRRTDRLQILLLEALTSGNTGMLVGLEDRARLGRALTRQIIRRLASEGLVTPTADGWTLSRFGEEARQRGEYCETTQERRTFYFTGNGVHSPPHFLNLRPDVAVPCRPPEGWAFDIGHLQRCIAQPPDWKMRHGFPLEVEELAQLDGSRVVCSSQMGDALPELEPECAPGGISAWQRVTFVQAEALTLLALVAPGPEGERLLGFAVHPQDWSIEAKEPLIVLGRGWPLVLPELAKGVSRDRWLQAWRAWAQANGVPQGQDEPCALVHGGHRVELTVPRGVLARLRASRGEALRNGIWLLAGEERARQAALLNIVARLH
jgi:hypothetical protein